MEEIFGMLRDKELKLDYIARDILLCELLVEKNIITQDEINKKFEKLEEKKEELEQLIKGKKEGDK